MVSRQRFLGFLLFALALAAPAVSRAQEAPVQAVLLVTVDDSGVGKAVRRLNDGDALVRARVTSVNAATARVVIKFSYRIPPDTIALDEIVDHILIQTDKPSEPPFSRAEIEPDDINLNPNTRVLRYAVTLNRPEGSYRTIVTVRGNYE